MNKKKKFVMLLDFAINRSMYSNEHLDYVIATVKDLYEDRESIPNIKIVWGYNLT